jgi:hypothetical protein
MTGPSGSALLPSDLSTQLAFPRSAVVNRIREAVDRGWTLLNSPVEGPVAFNSFRANRSKWDDNNRDMLRRLFRTDAPRLTYDKTGVVPPGSTTPALELELLRASVEHRLSLLQTMLDRLGGSDDGAVGVAKTHAAGTKPIVFIAHAGDIGLARTVGRFLEAQRMTAVIVTDSPGDGEIGVGQVDGYPDARFAIVLVAGEEGQSAAGGGERRKANPDAMMWLGYFTGRLGRRRVCGLTQPGLEQPARQFGIRSYSYDDGGGWKALVAKAIERADGDES